MYSPAFWYLFVVLLVFLALLRNHCYSFHRTKLSRGKSFVFISFKKKSGLALFSVRRSQQYISHTKSLIFSTVACNATPARHLCYVKYITPFPRKVSLGRLCSINKISRLEPLRWKNTWPFWASNNLFCFFLFVSWETAGRKHYLLSSRILGKSCELHTSFSHRKRDTFKIWEKKSFDFFSAHFWLKGEYIVFFSH